jgi:predicted dehydrogenase
MKQLKLGLLSTARINEWSVIQVMPRLGSFSLHAVASRDEARADHYGRKYAIPKRYGKYGDLISDPEIDAVYISAPNALHYEWTRKALLAGKHVLCEKPLSHDPAQILEIERVARANGLRVVEAMHYRQHPDIIKAIEIIRSGCIGEIEFISVYFFSNVRHRDDIRLQETLLGGALMDVGCYCLDLIRWISGDDSPKINETNFAYGDTGVDMTTRVSLLCHRKIPAQFHCSLEADSFDCGAEIRGARGTVLLKYPFLPVIEDTTESRSLFSCAVSGEAAKESWRYSTRTSYFYQLRCFREALDAGPAESPPVTGSYYNAALIAKILRNQRPQKPKYQLTAGHNL